MWQKLQQNKNWEYSTQVWYKKYHTAIEIGYQSRYAPIRMPIQDDSFEDQYRCRQRYTRKGIVTTVYTNSVSYAEKVLDHNMNKVLSVRSPINQEHLDAILDPDTKIEMKDKLYHGKYKFKVHTHKNYKLGFDRQMWSEKCDVANAWIKENFKKSRTLSQQYWNAAYAYMYGYPTYSDVMHLYTNDEMTLMLYKMAFGAEFHIEITRAFTPQDFASV